MHYRRVESLLTELWDERQAHRQDGTKILKADIAALERKTGQIMDRLLATDSPTLISVYENEIKRIENDRIALTEKLRAKDKPCSGFETLYRTGCDFLANPGNYGFLSSPKTVESCSDWLLTAHWPTARKQVIEPPNLHCYSKS